MAITNFIPTIWSENLSRALDSQYIGVANCNRDYEGEIKNFGSVVKICGVGQVTISKYTKDTDMSLPQTLSDTVTELKIDQAKYFNFQIDDVDRAQCTPKLMDAAMKVAAAGLATDADRYVYSLYESAGKTIIMEEVTAEMVLDSIIRAREILYNANVVDTSDVVVEVSPAIASLILKAKLNVYNDNAPILETGCLGSVAGCRVYVSNNIATEDGAGGSVFYKCFVRTRRAIAFAEQLSEIDAYRPEKRFADAVKGLHLYGAKVIYPNEMVVLDLSVPEE